MQTALLSKPAPISPRLVSTSSASQLVFAARGASKAGIGTSTSSPPTTFLAIGLATAQDHGRRPALRPWSRGAPARSSEASKLAARPQAGTLSASCRSFRSCERQPGVRAVRIPGSPSLRLRSPARRAMRDHRAYAGRRSALWRGGRAVEGARLESVYTGNRIAGSNPAPSANE